MMDRPAIPVLALAAPHDWRTTSSSERLQFRFPNRLPLPQVDRSEGGLFALRDGLGGYCRQFRRDIRGDWQVVEADNRNIAGNREAGVMQC